MNYSQDNEEHSIRERSNEGAAPEDPDRSLALEPGILVQDESDTKTLESSITNAAPRRYAKRGPRWQLLLWTVLWSLPLVIGVSALTLWLKQPLIGALLGSVVTALVGSLLARRYSTISSHQVLKYEQIDLLEVENNRLSTQLAQVTHQKTQLAQQYQLISMLAFRVRQVPEQRILFDTLVQGLRDLLVTDRVVVYRFNPDWSGTIIAESVDSAFPASLNETIGDPCFHQRHAAQYANGRTRAIADIYREPGLTDCHIRLLEQYRVRANLVVPIRQNDQLFGLLIAHHCKASRRWSDEDLSLMSKVVTEVEYLLEFLTQSQQKALSAKHAWFLGDISFRARQSSDLEDLYRSTVKGLRQLLAADRVMVYKFNPDWSGTMVAESVANDFTPVLHEKIDDPCFRGRYVDLYRNGRIRGINNIRQEPGLTECHIRQLEKFEVKANLVAPLRFQEQLFGLLIVHQCSGPRNWSADDTSVISQTATQLEYAVEHLHSLRDLESSIERSRLFGDIAFRARKSLDLDAVFRVVLEGGIKILQTNRLLVYRFNPDWSGTMISEAVSSDRWPRVLETKIFDPCFKGRYVDLYRNGRVRAINDIYQEPGLSDCHIRTLEQYDVKANLVAPIRVQGELYGLLIAHHCDGARIWTQSDEEFLSELATQTEYALGHLEFIAELENARQTAESVSIQQRQQRETIQHQLTDLRQSLEQAFSGDLRVRALAPEGDIGVFAHFLNDSIEHLQQIVQEVQRASETVTRNAHANQSSVAQLSAATLRQSDQLTDAMEAVESITGAIQQVDGNAQSAQLKVQQADQVFQEGDRAMNRTVDVISMLQTRVEETAQQVKRLGEASQNISRVVNLIRDLAGQTNVLALNASIEANSSGDQGQGFAVVAEEVRSLAEQSTVATREIETLVEEIQTETNQVVSAMESWGEEVSASTELVEMTRRRLTSISTLGGEIRVLVEAIAQATLVQRQASASVSHTMQDVRQISQENSHLSVNVAESFQQLLQVANRLQSRIDQFKVQ